MGRPAVLIPKGKRFERWVVLGPAEKIGDNTASMCRCKCGTVKAVLNASLKSGDSKSCGCLHKERASARVKTNPPRLKHGMRRTLTYSCWQSMVSRCLNKNDTNYPTYGGKGITVCSRWSDLNYGMLNFVEDLGERPSKAHSIDRIDGNKGYEPGNCRWATPAQQSQNVGLKKSNTLGYKGISRAGSKDNPWKAEIRSSGKRFHLGCFSTKEEAALAYNVASIELQGEYGVRNSIVPLSTQTTKLIFSKVLKVIKKTKET